MEEFARIDNKVTTINKNLHKSIQINNNRQVLVKNQRISEKIRPKISKIRQHSFKLDSVKMKTYSI